MKKNRITEILLCLTMQLTDFYRCKESAEATILRAKLIIAGTKL